MGKTFCLESCLWFLCGLDDESKHDPSIHDNTMKGIAALTTNPVAVDDGESTVKVNSHFVNSELHLFLSGGEACNSSF